MEQMDIENAENIQIENCEGIEYLRKIEKNSIDLILTDPPYIISKETGMDNFNNYIKELEDKGIEYVKKEEDWLEYISKEEIEGTDKQKDNYLRYGTIYGKKYCVQTNYGDWDKNFTMDKLEEFIKEYYQKLRKGGIMIMFFDIWKISYLKEIMEKCKFKQIRFIEWIKTNPVPLNSGRNYLTNCREIALLGVKVGKSTFHSKWDNAIYFDNMIDYYNESNSMIYQYPIQGGKKRFHPTQKSLKLFEELVKKHTSEGDVVLDTFLGSGTTALACKNINRKFMGCEANKEYYDKIVNITLE